MHYPNGQPAHVGDLVELKPGHAGRIVCAPDEHDFPDDFPRRDWDWLKRGVLIRTSANTLLHCRHLHGVRLVRAVGCEPRCWTSVGAPASLGR